MHSFYEQCENMLKSKGKFSVKYEYDADGDTCVFNIFAKNLKLASITVHNEYAPEITTQIYDINELSLYRSTGSKEEALKYLGKMVPDLDLLFSSDALKYETYYFLGRFVKGRVTSIEFNNSLSRINKKPLLRFILSSKKSIREPNDNI